MHSESRESDAKSMQWGFSKEKVLLPSEARRAHYTSIAHFCTYLSIGTRHSRKHANMGTVMHLWGGSCRLCRGELSNTVAVLGHASQPAANISANTLLSAQQEGTYS